MPDLPFDIWIQIAQKLLVRGDILNLSQTCRLVRAAIIPLIFKTATFSVLGQQLRRNYQDWFAQVCHARARIAFYANNRTILSAMRRMEIIHWSPICDSILKRFMVDGKERDMVDIRSTRYATATQYVDISRSLRGSLYALLAVMYQELADLVHLAPNLGSISVSETGSGSFDFLYRRPRASAYLDNMPSFPRRWFDSFPYNSVEFDAQSLSGSARDGHMPSILPVPRFLSRYESDTGNIYSRRQECLIELLEDIRVPILFVSLDADMLAQLTPAARTKIRGAKQVSIQSRDGTGTLDPFMWEYLENILKPVNDVQVKQFELCMYPWLEDCPELKHLPLQLTSFKGSWHLLPHIIHLADKLVAIELTDSPDDIDYVNLLKSNTMTNVLYLGLPFVYEFKPIQNAGNLWPSIKELSIPGCFPHESDVLDIQVSGDKLFRVLSTYPNVEVLHIICQKCSTLKQSMAFDLHATPRPPNSSLHCIEFCDSSIAYWNSIDGIWEFDITHPLMSDPSISPEEASTAAEMINDCLTTWHSGFPKPTLRKRTRMGVQKLFRKGKSKLKFATSLRNVINLSS
ncbi:hypothetical protein M422DRAFT_245570 [Sphaerobolus stellatus SS14]|nr:hypothetical protein M422DRAFT_245570 [Sphaerobolus stellatus SS14]